MPKPTEKPKGKKADTGPSMSLIQRLLGGPMSDKTARDWPALEKSMAGRQIEMPNESARLSRVMPMGPLSKMMNPDAYGVTGPLGTVALNRELIERDNQNIDDVLTHELAHVGQGPMGMIRQMYDPGVENEAINREAMRDVRREDIRLPNSGAVDPTIATRSAQTVTQKKFKPPPPERKWWQSTNDRNTLRPPENITGPRG